MMVIRPQTIGYSLVDSPGGLAAFTYEKIAEWTDSDGHPERVIGRDEILDDDITLYWLTDTGASADLQVAAIIVREQNGCGGMEHERPEKVPEFLRAVFREPTVRLRLRGQYAFLLRAADSGRRLPGEHVIRQTVGSREWRSRTNLPTGAEPATVSATIFGHATYCGRAAEVQVQSCPSAV
jgi:hypothetical protein